MNTVSAEQSWNLRRLFITGGGALLAIMAVGGLLDVIPSVPGLVLDPVPPGNDVIQALREMARTLGVVMSMLVGLTGIAVPLTASVYTPKLIELFVADRVNRVVFGFYVLANAFVLWNAYVVADGLDAAHARTRAMACMAVTVVGLLMIVPYVLHVLRFLIPRSIVEGLAGEVLRGLRAACRIPKDSPRMQDLRAQVLDDIQYLGKIALRSLDRYDRDTALEAIEALDGLFDAYAAKKQFLPGTWFRPTQHEIQSLGPELIREAHRQRAGVEVAILLEYSLVLPLAIGRLPEVVASIAASTRRFGVRATEAGDKGVQEQVTLFFNTFLRLALQRRHADSFYKFVYQYRRFAEEIVERDPCHTLRVVFFLDYYGHQAVRSEMGYLINVVAYDLAELCILAWEKGVACKTDLLDAVIRLDRDQVALMELPGVVKAQVILAARLLTRGDAEAASRLEEELLKVKREKLEEAFGQIVAATEENFWEIADRRRHLDHVEPRFRPAFEEMRERLLGKRLRGAMTQAFLRDAVPPEPTPTRPAQRLSRPPTGMRPAAEEAELPDVVGG